MNNIIEEEQIINVNDKNNKITNNNVNEKNISRNNGSLSLKELDISLNSIINEGII